MRKEKPLLLDEIKEKIDDANAMIITSYRKLEPNVSWQLRALLAKQDSQFEVVKKRLLVKAAMQSGVQLEEKSLGGHVGVVFVAKDDVIPSAKIVFKFSKENENLFNVICASTEGKIMPGAELEELSKLPGMDEMRAMLLALFISPMSQTLAVMEVAIAGPLFKLNNQSES